MRLNISKKHSTRPERVIYEILKELKTPFKHRWIIDGREVDFVVSNIAIEVDGHEQNTEKNEFLVEKGYIPIHFHNHEVLTERTKVKQEIKNLWHDQHDSQKSTQTDFKSK